MATSQSESSTNDITSVNGSAGTQSAETVEQPRYSKREIYSTMAGVLLVMLLASLDQTIVDTAMPLFM